MGIGGAGAGAALQTATSGGGKFFPGIVPAAINEASEIMQQLNVPFRTVTEFEYDKRGMITKMTTTQVTPLMLIMAVSAPAVVVAVIKIIELAAGTGKALGGTAEAAKEAAKSVVDTAIEEARKGDEGIFGVFTRIWNLRGAVKGFGIP